MTVPHFRMFSANVRKSGKADNYVTLSSGLTDLYNQAEIKSVLRV